MTTDITNQHLVVKPKEWLQTFIFSAMASYFAFGGTSFYAAPKPTWILYGSVGFQSVFLVAGWLLALRRQRIIRALLAFCLLVLIGLFIASVGVVFFWKTGVDVKTGLDGKKVDEMMLIECIVSLVKQGTRSLLVCLPLAASQFYFRRTPPLYHPGWHFFVIGMWVPLASIFAFTREHLPTSVQMSFLVIGFLAEVVGMGNAYREGKRSRNRLLHRWSLVCWWIMTSGFVVLFVALWFLSLIRING